MAEWLVRPRAVPDGPGPTLVVFPHAGAGPRAYARFAASMADAATVWLVQLPGRDARLDEPGLETVTAIVTSLFEPMRALARPPYVFFGHSFGAILAFELTRAFARGGHPLPAELIVSACHPPNAFGGQSTLPVETVDDVRRVLTKHGGTDPLVLANDELLALFLPAFRADFACARSYRHDPSPPLPIPLTILGGRDDRAVRPADLAGWRDYTASDCLDRLFEGGHFYNAGHPAFDTFVRDRLAARAEPRPDRVVVRPPTNRPRS